MRTRHLISLSVLGFAVACGGGPKPAPPEPKPTDAEVAMHQHALDSIAMADRARADSVERVRLATQARADSIEQSRLAEATRVRDSAEAVARSNAVLTDELAVVIHFDYDQSAIQPDGQAALDRKVAILTANQGVRLRITAHTDDRGSEEYNLALGNRRAASTKKYLVSRGIDASRVDGSSMGEESPVDSSPNEAAWAQNRRATFEAVGVPNSLMAPVALQ